MELFKRSLEGDTQSQNIPGPPIKQFKKDNAPNLKN